MDAVSTLRVVLVHDWLTGMRGGEKVLEALAGHWPSAPIFTLLHQKGSLSPLLEAHPIHTSLLQSLPGIHRWYRYALPIMPWAVGWDFPACDLVLSSSHCVAKGVVPPAGVPHVCYCHTPMRYAWNMRDAYFQRRGMKAWVIHRLLDRLREWDRRTAAHVTHFIANSQVVRRRIQECYQREAVVIPPPVDTNFYCPAPVPREDFFLVLSAFAPYKRLDLAVEACKRLDRNLVIIGSGQEENKLRALAGPKTTFLGWQSAEVLRDHLRKCKALLFPGEEDFGIVPVEAQACGTPVIAFGQGGATETVVGLGDSPHPTGVFFPDQSVDALVDAVERFERERDGFTPAHLRHHALRFRTERFNEQILDFLREVMSPISTQRRAA